MNTPSVQQITERLTQALHIALDDGLHPEKVDPSRSARLRISSFPFCHIRWFLELERSKKAVRFNPSRMRYYTKVGHVLHEMMQDGLLDVDLQPTGLTVICDWVCLKCRHRHFFSPRVEECAKCGSSQLKHEEHEIDDYPVMGHIDNVFRVKIGKTFFYFVIDYKTTSMKGLKSGKLPYRENVEQLSAYANEIRRKGHSVLPFVFLVYVPRDNPGEFKCFPVDVNFDREELKRQRYINRFNRAAVVYTEKQACELIASRPCANGLKKTFEGCKKASVCAGPNNVEPLTEQVIRVFHEVKERLPMNKFAKAKDG